MLRKIEAPTPSKADYSLNKDHIATYAGASHKDISSVITVCYDLYRSKAGHCSIDFDVGISPNRILISDSSFVLNSNIQFGTNNSYVRIIRTPLL